MPADPFRPFDRDSLRAPEMRRLAREVERREEIQVAAAGGALFDTPSGLVLLPKLQDGMHIVKIRCNSTSSRWVSGIDQDIDASTNPPTLRDSSPARMVWAHVLSPTPLPQHGDYALCWDSGIVTTLQERRDPSGSGVCSPASPGATELPPETRPALFYC